VHIGHMKPSHQCTKQEDIFGGGRFHWRRCIFLDEVFFCWRRSLFLEEVDFIGGGVFFGRKCFFVGGGDVCFWSRVALTGHRSDTLDP